jgi:septum formation protein
LINQLAMIFTHKSIYLASASPRRAELIAQMGIHSECLPSNIDETPLSIERPEDFVIRMAAEKAQVCRELIKSKEWPIYPILGADTVVSLDSKILGKPKDEDDAIRVLKELSGKAHWVHTGIAVIDLQGALKTALSSTEVVMSEWTMPIIQAYLASGEPMDKAGAYGIQGKASLMIKSISGSYSGVMGLPLYESAQLLAWAGVDVLSN